MAYNKDAELVLVVPAEPLKALGGDNGFHAANNQQKLDFILANQRFLTRGQVETDPAFKQIIPYVMVKHSEKYLLFQRTTKQAEQRLHNKYSLGAGGHINQETLLPGETIIQAALRRELGEEVTVRGNQKITLLGSINDNSNPVGQVHFGLVFLVETDSPEFQVNEPDNMTAVYKLPAELQEFYPGMESWSQILFQNVLAK